MSAIDCMPRGLTYDAGLTGCQSAIRLLATLAAFNTWSAVLSLLFGKSPSPGIFKRLTVPQAIFEFAKSVQHAQELRNGLLGRP